MRIKESEWSNLIGRQSYQIVLNENTKAGDDSAFLSFYLFELRSKEKTRKQDTRCIKNEVVQRKYIFKLKKIKESNIDGSTRFQNHHVEQRILDILICNMSKVII